MKKCLKELFVLSVGAIYLAAPAFADGLVFDPATKTEQAVNTKSVKDISDAATRQTNSLQNALFELDSVQVEIRNQLLEERSKYTDIDTQYKLVKEQRKQQKKTIRDAEKKIRQIERTKTQVRNSMGLAQ